VISHSFLERDPRVRRTVECMLEEGWEVSGLFLDPAHRTERLWTWRVPLARRRGSVVRHLFEYGAFFVWALAWVTIRVVRRRPHLVYVNTPPDALVFTALAAKLTGVPVILDVHDPMPELLVAKGNKSGWLRKLLVLQERWSLRFADKVITVHEPLRELLHERSPKTAIEVVMNVPDASEWRQIEHDGRSRTIVYTGSVAIRYGLDDVLTAMADVASEIPNVRLRVIGEGEDLGLLRRMATDLGIDERVDFMGLVPWEEVRAVQADAWIGVNVPKPDELGNLSFSNKVVEWVALGLPVIASRTSTLLRYFPEGTLFYVDPGSAARLAKQLMVLHEMDETEMARHVDAARASLEKITWPVQRRRLLETLWSVLPASR
jgi:glycosyltransferase involved in cell wall biosynthesis